MLKCIFYGHSYTYSGLEREIDTTAPQPKGTVVTEVELEKKCIWCQKRIWTFGGFKMRKARKDEL